MNIEQAYIEMQKNCGIKVGDTVKVLRTAKDYENGWCQVWDKSGMDKTVDNTFKVQSAGNEEGIFLENGFLYPFYVLELVDKSVETKEMSQKEFDELCEKTFGHKIRIKNPVKVRSKDILDENLKKEILNKEQIQFFRMSEAARNLLKKNKNLTYHKGYKEEKFVKNDLPVDNWHQDIYSIPQKNIGKVKI